MTAGGDFEHQQTNKMISSMKTQKMQPLVLMHNEQEQIFNVSAGKFIREPTDDQSEENVLN